MNLLQTKNNATLKTFEKDTTVQDQVLNAKSTSQNKAKTKEKKKAAKASRKKNKK